MSNTNRIDPGKIKVVAFDLDGTLTQHKEPLSKANKEALDALGKRYRLLMVGAGQVMRINRQMGNYPIDIIGNYGLQFAEFDTTANTPIILRDLCFDCNREAIEMKVNYLRDKHGFTSYRGNSVEYHPSGCVTFPILGTEAIQEDKLRFDPDRSRRRAIYDEVCALFSDYCVFVGGSSSFDMAPKPYNKYHALCEYCERYGYDHSEVVFMGDDYGTGGNDESVYRSDFGFICVDDYTKFPQYIKPLLP